MITIVAKSVLKPGMKKAFTDKARELILKSRAESGNISYNLVEDISDDNVVSFIEEWKNQAAIDEHNSSEHFLRIVPELGQFREGEAEVRLYRQIDV